MLVHKTRTDQFANWSFICCWQVIQTITAVDKDDFANGKGFSFSFPGGIPANPNFTIKDNEGMPRTCEATFVDMPPCMLFGQIACQYSYSFNLLSSTVIAFFVTSAPQVLESNWWSFCSVPDTYFKALPKYSSIRHDLLSPSPYLAVRESQYSIWGIMGLTSHSSSVPDGVVRAP